MTFKYLSKYLLAELLTNLSVPAVVKSNLHLDSENLKPLYMYEFQTCILQK